MASGADLLVMCGLFVTLGAAKYDAAALLSYNPEHVLVEEAPRDAVA